MSDAAALRALSDAYATAADARDLEALRSCFLPDGRLTLLAGTRPPRIYDGHAGLAAAITELAQFTTTLHHVTTCLVATDGDTARGAVTGVAHHVSAAGAQAWDLVLQMRYEDGYVRGTGGSWLIRERRARIVFSERRPVRLP